MNIIRVIENTYCIDAGTSYIPFYKINEKEIIMLDTGLKNEQCRGIEEVLESNNLTIKAIINTHSHIDHVGNNVYFKEKYNSIIAMPSYEAFICSSDVNLKLYYGDETLKFIKKHYGHMVFKTDIIIKKDEDEISVCDVKFKIVHTPGHSPSHICIITPDNVAYVGDALISYELIKVLKIPYTFILGEDMKSKAKLYDLNCSKYIAAHKGMYDDITKLIDDNIDFYENIAMKIYDLITKPMSMEEILQAAAKKFKIYINDPHKYYIIRMMLKSYLDYLAEIEKLEIVIKDNSCIYVNARVKE